MRLPLIAFCLGIWLLQQQATLPSARWLALLPLLLAVLWLPAFSRPAAEFTRRLGIVLLCAALGFAWAAWRADTRLAERLPAHWQGVDIELVGVITDLPHANARGERFIFEIEQVLTRNAPALQRVQLTRYWPREATRHDPRMQAGERWRLTVRMKMPHGTSNPHGFDLEAWMLERRINASGYVREAPAPQRIAAQAHTPGAWIAAARASVRERIFTTLGDAPHAGVIAALVVGDQRSIPHQQWRAFTRTGVNHLLSISGLHVTMIAALAGWLVASVWRRLPRYAERLPARQAGLVAAVLAAFGYALLAGFQVPAQRTLFMLTVLALAFWSRREPRPFSALLVALFVVLLIDPWAVLSAGFWLSFGAMATILWVTLGRVALPDKVRGWVTVRGCGHVGAGAGPVSPVPAGFTDLAAGECGGDSPGELADHAPGFAGGADSALVACGVMADGRAGLGTGLGEQPAAGGHDLACAGWMGRGTGARRYGVVAVAARVSVACAGLASLVADAVSVAGVDRP